MNFESWYADYLEKMKSELDGLEFSLLQLNAIYKLLKAAFEAGKMANKEFNKDQRLLIPALGRLMKRHTPYCHNHYPSLEGIYSSKHDSYYCKECNIWLEEKCNDFKCEYCNKRPNNPIQKDAKQMRF